MKALSAELRNRLQTTILTARHEAESACHSSLNSLGVEDEDPPSHLDEDQQELRLGLRAKLRQLGWDFDLLVSECAYEQWHRLLFARFLAENNLLLHPTHKVPVTIVECEELAASLGEPDGWAVAGRFAAEILPGIFRLDDPCSQLRLAPEGRQALEGTLAELPSEVFQADDSLGWVYQFWQKEKKDEVNRSERKIGGADLGPVTQLFTENYMVRFLLENSLGAWWAARHPDSPLLKELEYLRLDDDGKPAAGGFDEWPEQVSEVTVMDPCCGSGHFLVEAFQMLWRMRSEEQGSDPIAAQDAVLEDNLFGLELDPRCVQIAMFAIALTAWKEGGGWRELPVPHIACSGIPAKATLEEWTGLAGSDQRLGDALARLHAMFKDADTLGSLIDPRRAAEVSAAKGPQRSFEDVDWEEVAPLLEQASEQEAEDPATAVLGASAAGIARAAGYLSRRYTLVATNVPYLTRGGQGATLRDFSLRHFPIAEPDLATVFLERAQRLVPDGGRLALVSPQSWLFQPAHEQFRTNQLVQRSWRFLARLGPGAFRTISGEVVQVCLYGTDSVLPAEESATYFELDVSDVKGVTHKSSELVQQRAKLLRQAAQLQNPASIIMAGAVGSGQPLSSYSDIRAGIATGDIEVFFRRFWELSAIDSGWERCQGATDSDGPMGGRSNVVLWEEEQGRLAEWADSLRHRNHAAQKWRRGKPLWGKTGIAVNMMGNLRTSLYLGDRFDHSVAVIVPDEEMLLPLWRYCRSEQFVESVRAINTKIGVESGTLLNVPFDPGEWSSGDQFPDPYSDDPTQWLFKGRPEDSTEPLQVGVGCLVGYRWPEQEDDDLDPLADDDGIVCLPSVAGEPPASDRLEQLLAKAYGTTWSPTKSKVLIEQAGSKKKSVADWLRDEFFKQHCKVFANRPFVWHIWDGRKDGFSALVNYHRLDRAMLEKLTFTYLGQDWVERQRSELQDEVPGAEDRLAAAQELQSKLEAILEGEPPYDIYVRWKPLEEQPIGWEPDLNDGVRLNIRPFVEAGILRSKVTVNWKKDRGKNPDGSERINDRHLTRAEKLAARGDGG